MVRRGLHTAQSGTRFRCARGSRSLGLVVYAPWMHTDLHADNTEHPGRSTEARGGADGRHGEDGARQDGTRRVDCARVEPPAGRAGGDREGSAARPAAASRGQGTVQRERMAVLVDTSIWITHLSKGSPELRRLLDAGEVLAHPLVIGELACGNLKNRAEIPALLRTQPSARVAGDDEVLAFIEARMLSGRGLGLVDVHLLASAALSRVPLWTANKRLRDASASLGLGYP